jgi:cobalt-zinc-cadmium efflux system membrane fusion protein
MQIVKRNFPKNWIILLIIATLTHACSSSDSATDENMDSDIDGGFIELSSEQFNSASMKLGTISDQVFKETVTSYGVIDVPPENKASISAYFGGYVKKLKLIEGQKVIKGQLLFSLENPEYVEIQQAFLEAKGQLAYLKSDYDRQKNLASDNVTSQKIYLKAEADYKVTLVRYESLKKKLQLMNIDPGSLNAENIRSEIQITSPISGFIASVKAMQGMFLNRDDIALTIINTDHIHLELNIFEKDLPSIHENQEIRFFIQNKTNKAYQAEVYLVGNYIDPVKRSVSIHGHLVNEDETSLFAPGMYIEAAIYTSSDTLKALPTSAIISSESKSFVLVKMKEEGEFVRFEQREVLPGAVMDGYTAIKNDQDFSAKDEILLEGSFNLIGE